MVTLSCSAWSSDGVTLVTGHLDGSRRARRVRLENRLDGPVWPPRSYGVPEAGWDDESFETVVPAAERVAFGYASPAPPADPPVALVAREPVEGDDGDASVSPSTVLRELGDPSPPRDAIPIPEPGSSTASSSQERATLGKGTDEGPASDDRPLPDAQPTVDSDRLARPPEAVARWLDTVEGRVAVAEELTAAGTLPEATAAVRRAGSLADAADLAETIPADAAALASVADRAAKLADRADETDVPLSTLERLA